MVVQKVYHCYNEILEWKWSSNNGLMPPPFWTSIFLIDGLLFKNQRVLKFPCLNYYCESEINLICFSNTCIFFV